MLVIIVNIIIYIIIEVIIDIIMQIFVYQILIHKIITVLILINIVLLRNSKLLLNITHISKLKILTRGRFFLDIITH